MQLLHHHAYILLIFVIPSTQGYSNISHAHKCFMVSGPSFYNQFFSLRMPRSFSSKSISKFYKWHSGEIYSTFLLDLILILICSCLNLCMHALNVICICMSFSCSLLISLILFILLDN